MNGIPVTTFDSAFSTSGNPQQMFTRNGDNLISVEVVIAESGGTMEVAFYDAMQSILKKQKLTKSGMVNYTLRSAGYPDWAWVNADKVVDGKTEVLKAVAGLHALLVRKDGDGFNKLRRPLLDDRAKLRPDLSEEELREVRERTEDSWVERLAIAKVSDLPSDLSVESFEDGRLWVVTRPDQKAPVQINATEGSVESVGQHWSRFNGEWKMVR